MRQVAPKILTCPSGHQPVPVLADVRVPHGDGERPRVLPRCLEGQEKNKTTNFTMPNNISFMKCSLNSVHGLADVGVLLGDGDGPRTPPRCQEGARKSFK